MPGSRAHSSDDKGGTGGGFCLLHSNLPQGLEPIKFHSYQKRHQALTVVKQAPPTDPQSSSPVAVVTTYFFFLPLVAVRQRSYDMALALVMGGACVEQVCLTKWTATHEAAKVAPPSARRSQRPLFLTVPSFRLTSGGVCGCSDAPSPARS